MTPKFEGICFSVRNKAGIIRYFVEIFAAANRVPLCERFREIIREPVSGELEVSDIAG